MNEKETEKQAEVVAAAVVSNLVNQDYIESHGAEHARLAGLIRSDIKQIKDLVMLLIIVVFVCLSIITITSVLTARTVGN